MTPGPCMSRFHVNRSLRFLRHANTVYLHNAKAGCSTAKATLMREASRSGHFPQIPTGDFPPSLVHGPGDWWAKQFDLFDASTTFFTIVRNPYTRTLSAYLDKICRDNHIRAQFLSQHGLPPDEAVSFEQFLDLVDMNTQLPDEHWDRQTDSVMWRCVQRPRAYFLENLSEMADDLRAHLRLDAAFEVRRTHATGAAEKLAEHLTPLAAQRIQKLYAQDFVAFGYSLDPSEAGHAPGAYVEGDAPDRRSAETVTLIGRTSRPPESRTEAHQLWDAAETYEQQAALMAWESHLGGRRRHTFDEDTRITLERGDRNCVFLARRYVVAHPRRFETELVDSCLHDLVTSAPYLLPMRSRLVARMIAAGRFDEAEREIDRLPALAWEVNRTWHEETVPHLRQKLRDARRVSRRP